jgi:hypothetical protein
MRALSPAEILRAWEQGAARAPLDRALLLLGAAMPDETDDALASLPIGERDRRLLELRRRTFGDDVPLFARCPACGEAVELSVRASDLLALGEGASSPAEPRALVTQAATLHFRMLNSADLAYAAGRDDAEQALLERCVVDATIDGRPVAATSLPDALREALAAAMAEADPHAEIQLALGCPACEHRWSMVFDVVTVLWSDVTRFAGRLLQEVDALARVYGWREEDVLALSAHRRAVYVEMALS